MPLSNYPNGFKNGVAIRGLPLMQTHSGKIYYVNNSTVKLDEALDASNINDGSFLRPYRTIDFAVGKCLANRHDIIMCMPGHSETISAAAAIDLDVDGITLLGLGSGDKQAQIISDNAVSTVEVNADNVTIQGIRFTSGATVVAKGIDIVDGADDYYISNCRFDVSTLTTFEYEDCIFVTTADRGVIENCYIDMDASTGADTQSAIHLVGICLGTSIRDNYITGDYAVACIESITVAQEQLLIENNTLVNGVHGGLGTLACISLLTGSSGVIQNNRLYTNVTTAVTGAIVADGCFMSNNTIATTAESGSILAESAPRGQNVEISILDSIDDESTQLFVIDGTVRIHGLFGIVTTVMDGAEDIAIITEATSTPVSQTIWATAETHTGTAAGDVVSATAFGLAPTVTEVTAAEGLTQWTAPLTITGSQSIMDLTNAGVGAGIMTYVCIWDAVTSDGEIALA